MYGKQMRLITQIVKDYHEKGTIFGSFLFTILWR